MRQVVGADGSIRALEVTHGQAGWHPHVHVLLLTSAPLADWQRAASADPRSGRVGALNRPLRLPGAV